MAIGLKGSPQTLTPGFNPVYWYAESDNTSLINFRYLFKVTNFSTNEILFDSKIKPRFGDDLLEVNISKILQNDLGTSVDDININTNTLIWNNSASSGFRYRIDIGEEYEQTWLFDDTNFLVGQVSLVSLTASPFVVGDEINVNNAAEFFNFTDNQFDSGLVGYLMVDNPSGVINVSDTVTIQQDSGYTFPQYNGSFTVSSVSTTVVTVNFPFQGNTPPEPGTLIRNYQYDGLAIVDGVGTVSSGPYTGYHYITYGQTWINNSPQHGGSVIFSDSRLFQDESLFIDNDKYVFNGASSHKDWLDWDFTEYDPSGSGEKWLTTIPNDYIVTLDNDVYANIWGNKFPGGMFDLKIKTYDSSNILNGEFDVFNTVLPASQTEIQTLSVGPIGLNGTLTYSVATGSVPMIDCDVDHYEVYIIAGLGVTQSDTLTFSVDCSCLGRYTNYPILFMDRFGSFIPINFSLNNKQKVGIKRDKYKKFIGGLSNGAYTYNTTEHSMRNYNIDLDEVWELNTDWMTEEMSLYFEELTTTGIAFILIDGDYHAINVIVGEYERVRKINNKNIRYTIDISFSNNNNINI